MSGFVSPAGIELKHLCLEYMTPWLLNLVRFCKHNDDAKRQRVTAILDKLITMTINEKQMYPSIQAKIWGSLGQVSGPAEGVRGRGRQTPRDSVAASQITDLLDVVLDSFIKTSATGGLGSIKAEVMADTAVALASGNVKLVSSKVRVLTLPSPPPRLSELAHGPQSFTLAEVSIKASWSHTYPVLIAQKSQTKF